MRNLLLIFLFLVLLGCSKEQVKIDFEVISSPINSRIRAVDWLDGQFVFCGGEIDGKGFVLTSKKDLSNVQVKLADLEFPLFDVVYFHVAFLPT